MGNEEEEIKRVHSYSSNLIYLIGLCCLFLDIGSVSSLWGLWSKSQSDLISWIVMVRDTGPIIFIS